MKANKMVKKFNLRKMSVADLGDNDIYKIRDARGVIIGGGAETPSCDPYGNTCPTKVEPPCPIQQASWDTDC